MPRGCPSGQDNLSNVAVVLNRFLGLTFNCFTWQEKPPGSAHVTISCTFARDSACTCVNRTRVQRARGGSLLKSTCSAISKSLRLRFTGRPDGADVRGRAIHRAANREWLAVSKCSLSRSVSRSYGNPKFIWSKSL
jgi:hypothetical protein